MGVSSFRVEGIYGSFPKIGTLSGTGFRTSENSVMTLLNRGKTNGDALVGALYNRCGPSSKRVCFRNGGLGVADAHGTVRRGVYTICRRLDLIPRLAVTRGLFLNFCSAGTVKEISCGSLRGEALRLFGGCSMSPVGPGAGMGVLPLTRGRILRVLGTLGESNSVVVFSRTASTLPSGLTG